MTFVFDIDGTICTLTDGEYGKAKPLKQRIEKINKLYGEGNTIVFHTARGMGRTDNNALMAHRLFFYLTETQLEDWGVKYHNLFMGKPSGDLYIDDKGVKDEDYFDTRD
jgi:hypothetical protein